MLQLTLPQVNDRFTDFKQSREPEAKAAQNKPALFRALSVSNFLISSQRDLLFCPTSPPLLPVRSGYLLK